MLKKSLRTLAYLALSNQVRINFRTKLINRNNLLTILNLHRVSPNQNSTFKPLSPILFRDLLVFCKKNFNIISFKDIPRKNSQSNSEKPLLILSFDDGYKDFIDYAMPILYEHKVCVNQNFIPGCVESGLPPLNVFIQDFIAQAPSETIKDIYIPGFNIENIDDRGGLGFLISKFLKNKSEESRNQIMKEALPQILNFEELNTVQMMNVDEVIECEKQHEIGLHSYTHASMNFETDYFFEDDLVNCINWYKRVLKSDPTIYAFPNGSYKESQIKILNNHGFSNILLVNDSFSSLENRLHNRIKFHGNSSNEIEFRALGGVRKLQGNPL